MEVFQGSNLGEIIDEEMFIHMKTQVENLALTNCRFVFDRVLFLDINFHKLKLTRSSSYLLLPDWISSKNVVINPKNKEDEEWFVLGALHHQEIGDNLQQILKLRRLEDSYDWRRLEFPLPLRKISVFEQNKDISVNVLATGGGKEKLYIRRKAKLNSQRRTTNLLLIVEDEKRHYPTIKNLSQLLRSSNSEHHRQQYFSLNCLQGFPCKEPKNKHFQCCVDHEAVKTDIPEENSFLRFHSGQYQFKVPSSSMLT